MLNDKAGLGPALSFLAYSRARIGHYATWAALCRGSWFLRKNAGGPVGTIVTTRSFTFLVGVNVRPDNKAVGAA